MFKNKYILCIYIGTMNQISEVSRLYREGRNLRGRDMRRKHKEESDDQYLSDDSGSPFTSPSSNSDSDDSDELDEFETEKIKKKEKILEQKRRKKMNKLKKKQQLTKSRVKDGKVKKGKKHITDESDIGGTNDSSDSGDESDTEKMKKKKKKSKKERRREVNRLKEKHQLVKKTTKEGEVKKRKKHMTDESDISETNDLYDDSDELLQYDPEKMKKKDKQSEKQKRREMRRKLKKKQQLAKNTPKESQVKKRIKCMTESSETNDISEDENQSDEEDANDISEDKNKCNEEDVEEKEGSEDERNTVESGKKKSKPIEVRCIIESCGKMLKKHKSGLRRHFKGKIHRDMTPREKADAIAIMNKRKDYRGRPSKINRKDNRNRRRMCMWCERTYSYTALRKYHLNPHTEKSRRCKRYPKEGSSAYPPNLPKEELQKWINNLIDTFPKSQLPRQQTQQDLMSPSANWKIEEMLHQSEEYHRTPRGKTYVQDFIKQKLVAKERLTPEEYKRNYRSTAVRNHQRRIFNHVYGNQKFISGADLEKLDTWMATDDDAWQFRKKHVIKLADGETDEQENHFLANSTLATYCRSLIVFLQWAKRQFNTHNMQQKLNQVEEGVRQMERNFTGLAKKSTRRKNLTSAETKMLNMKDLDCYVHGEDHTSFLNNLRNNSWMATEAAKLTRKQIYTLQCFLAVDISLHTGKRPGLLCGIKHQDIKDARKHDVIHFENTNEQCFQIIVCPSDDTLTYKNVSVGFLNVKPHMFKIIERVSDIKLKYGGAELGDYLFTSPKGFPLLHLNNEMKGAWAKSGCESNINSTMIRHTIVTGSRNDNLSLQELKALARGMDHSIRIAEEKYLHDQEKRAIDYSKTIISVLKLNKGIDGWLDEGEQEMKDDIEYGAATGQLILIEDEKAETPAEDGQKKGVGRKIGNTTQLFSDEDTTLMRRLFREYIEKQAADPSAVNFSSEIKEIYNDNIKEMDDDSDYACLKNYGIDKIVQKVRTLIDQERKKIKRKNARNDGVRREGENNLEEENQQSVAKPKTKKSVKKAKPKQSKTQFRVRANLVSI